MLVKLKEKEHIKSTISVWNSSSGKKSIEGGSEIYPRNNILLMQTEIKDFQERRSLHYHNDYE